MPYCLNSDSPGIALALPPPQAKLTIVFPDEEAEAVVAPPATLVVSEAAGDAWAADWVVAVVDCVVAVAAEAADWVTAAPAAPPDARARPAVAATRAKMVRIRPTFCIKPHRPIRRSARTKRPSRAYL